MARQRLTKAPQSVGLTERSEVQQFEKESEAVLIQSNKMVIKKIKLFLQSIIIIYIQGKRGDIYNKEYKNNIYRSVEWINHYKIPSEKISGSKSTVTNKWQQIYSYKKIVINIKLYD